MNQVRLKWGERTLDAANQQKILGYFIEEAREHLETLAQGVMDLPKVCKDPEALNELFRAAHSVKGGSAMLGYDSIQKTAHRLEDCFKILKEHDVPVDSKLEALFLKGYDTLHTLLDHLESPDGLQDATAHRITKAAEPDFDTLENYLHQLVSGEVVEESPKPQKAPVATPPPSDPFANETKALLKEMLALFKAKATPEGRKQLQKLCVRLAKLAPKEKGWQMVTKSCHQVIGNPKYSYRTLAPVIIKELKHNSDLKVLGQSDEIHVSPTLKQLAEAKTPQVLIPVEPKAAAKTLINVFSKQQLSQLVELLAAK
ncbi:Hpt domain-containing protein [Spirulina subsalsa FACHB-351]|uniref:Hpt domain-containing protein n=1 Tax=Spirulina subsalsa FACHB-351 TaxID=234711 RepID=A0ABT3L4Z6_9CYAN|nr:Hpt domain-containing protein [Spirulina subsalsa]MCW6036586.1 Hpt domain-containing protein [Spirulina subsalsa FACHB-351]